MPPASPLRLSGTGIDLSPRFFRSGAVVASPALAAETIIASVTVTADLAVGAGVKVQGFCAFTVGASGVSVGLRIRKTNVSGTALIYTGLTTVTAADLRSATIFGFDASPTLPNQVYVLTAIVTSGAAESTVSAVELQAFVL